MKSRKQINELKEAWLKEPCWDIEDTRGFKDHQEELHNWRLEQAAKWKAEAKGHDDDLRITHFYGVVDEVSFNINKFYNQNPEIEIVSREMSTAYDPRQECVYVTYFITYKKVKSSGRPTDEEIESILW